MWIGIFSRNIQIRSTRLREVRVKSEFKSFTKVTQWGLKQGEAQVPVFMVSDSQNIFYIQMYVMWPRSGSSEGLLSYCHYA